MFEELLEDGSPVVVYAAHLFALATTALARNDRMAVTDRASCGGALSRLATLSDPQRSLVNLQPKPTTLAAIAALPQPHPTPRTRNNAFARQVWKVCR